MHWTKTPPTLAGFYWAKPCFGPPEVIEAVLLPTGKIVCYDTMGSEDETSAYVAWAGPLQPPPEEPP